jgi:hypothetical protein
VTYAPRVRGRRLLLLATLVLLAAVGLVFGSRLGSRPEAGQTVSYTFTYADGTKVDCTMSEEVESCQKVIHIIGRLTRVRTNRGMGSSRTFTVPP